MFYVAEGKIYSTQYSEALKGYPEFKVTADHELVPTGKAVAENPKNRQVCEAFEVLAQIRYTAVEPKKAKAV